MSRLYCPRCGYAVLEAGTCPACHAIVKAEHTSPPEQPAQSAPRRRYGFTLILGLALIALLVVAYLLRHQTLPTYTTRPLDRILLVGPWVNAGLQTCIEGHLFDPQGVYLLESSNGEQVQGVWLFHDEPIASGRYRVDLALQSDNGRPDCYDDATDDTNTRHIIYLEMDEDGRRLYVFRSPFGGSPDVTLVRPGVSPP